MRHPNKCDTSDFPQSRRNLSKSQKAMIILSLAACLGVAIMGDYGIVSWIVFENRLFELYKMMGSTSGKDAAQLQMCIVFKLPHVLLFIPCAHVAAICACALNRSHILLLAINIVFPVIATFAALFSLVYPIAISFSRYWNPGMH